MSIQPIAIQTRQLSKRLGSRMVLRDIDLRVASGECVALTGDNGAGKTTLLRCLAGITRPSAGEVCWFGRLVDADPQQRRIVGMDSTREAAIGWSESSTNSGRAAVPFA